MDLGTAAEILDAFPYLAKARVYYKDLVVERGRRAAFRALADCGASLDAKAVRFLKE